MTGLFVRKIGAENSRLYELTVPLADGRKAYYKLSVEPLKEVLFNKACKEGLKVDLKDFGTIIESYYMPAIIKPITEDVK